MATCWTLSLVWRDFSGFLVSPLDHMDSLTTTVFQINLVGINARTPSILPRKGRLVICRLVSWWCNVSYITPLFQVNSARVSGATMELYYHIFAKTKFTLSLGSKRKQISSRKNPLLKTNMFCFYYVRRLVSSCYQRKGTSFWTLNARIQKYNEHIFP